MASEIDRANSQELRDLNETYRKRREQIQEEGEADLEQARKENTTRLRTEKSIGEAAVNHTRLANKERVEQMKADADQKFIYERNANQRAIQTEKLRGQEHIASLEDNQKTRESQLNQNMRQITRRENEVRSKENEYTNAIAQEQAKRRSQLMGQEQEKLKQFGEKVQQRKAELNEQARDEMAQLSTSHRKEMEHLQQEHKQIYNKQQQAAESAVRTQIAEQNRKLDAERERFSKQSVEQQNRAKGELEREQENATHKLLQIRQDNQHQSDRAHVQGAENMEKARSYYDRQISEIERKGDAAIADRRDTQETRLRLLDEQNKTKLESEKADHSAALQYENDVYAQQSQNNKEFYRKSLLDQKKEYDAAFKKNLEAFAKQVETQRGQLQQTLAREKREVAEDVGKYNKKSGDPFYRITEPKAKLTESQDHYIVQAKIPEHEKDNVKVLVQDNKIIVSGQRRFADEIKEPDNKISTHSYQTYRQEIALEHPVIEKVAQKSYKDGVLTVKIPKA